MDAWQDDYADMRRFFIYGESLDAENRETTETGKIDVGDIIISLN